MVLNVVQSAQDAGTTICTFSMTALPIMRMCYADGSVGVVLSVTKLALEVLTLYNETEFGR